MTNRRSLFFKYFSICTAVILISFICLGAVLLLISSNFFNREKEETLEKAVGNITGGVAASMKSSPGEWRMVSQIKLNEYSNNARADIFIVDSTGAVVLSAASSDASEMLGNKTLSHDLLEQYSEDPTSVYTDLDGALDEQTMTVGQKFKGNGPEYLLIAIPFSDRANNYTYAIMNIFIVSCIIVLIISMVIIYFTSIKMTDPIKEMGEAAKQIGRGDFDIHLPEYSEAEYNDLAAAFNEMAVSIKNYDTMRNGFIANVSHELRTPMTSIGGFVDGLLDETIPPEEQRHYLEIISSEVHRLTRLVRSMLNLAKIEAGELKPNFSRFSVLDPIVDTLITFEKRLEEKNIEVRGLDTDKRYYLWADIDLIHQVVYNLLENAIKFVDVGGYISFHFQEVGYFTIIYIRNSGEGLSQEELSLVFDRFYKTDKSRSMDASGVGLGLNIVRSIIKLHGGKIQVRSIEKEYTEFIFSLPNKDIT
ncbi:MAG: HAMP domain-containing histidine kinase [Ruminococcus sp.]|nr:HAMP domain-containing histidine kinase [Ruminococcus sp.]